MRKNTRREKKMIDTYRETHIDMDSLDKWFKDFMGEDFKNKELIIINRDDGRHCTGESKYFAKVIIDEPLTKKELIILSAEKYNRDNQLYFYVDDILSAAVKEDVLESDSFCVYCQW